MIPATISRLIILVIGVLYPAYESHKTIRARNIQGYVRWILYWIAYSLFICAETFTDIFVAWLPFYYELKIVFVIWLVLPFTNGGNILFRYIIRPQFSKWEKVADHLLATLRRDSLSYSLVFLTRSLHCIVNFVVEKSLMTHSKIVHYVEHRAGKSENVDMPTRNQEHTDLALELEVQKHTTVTEKLENAVTQETQEMIMSASDHDCGDVKPQVKVELHSTPTDLRRKAIHAGEYQDQEVLCTSDYECSNIQTEPETELSSSITRRRRKATGRKMKRVEVTEAHHLLSDSEQLYGEVTIRTTRANKYVCC